MPDLWPAHTGGDPAMTTTMTMRTATEIVNHLRAHGFREQDAVRRQVLALVEEAGEFVGAYRRWAGLARWTGTETDVQAELADVVITAYVTAAELGVTLDVSPTPYTRPHDVDVVSVVLDVAVAANAVVWPYQEQRPQAYPLVLAEVVRTATVAAVVLGIDLDAAITAKLAVIFSRGWREPAAESGVDALSESVPCGFGCGYLADSETDLNEHEADCDRDPLRGITYGEVDTLLAAARATAPRADVDGPPPSRPVWSLRCGNQAAGEA